MHHVHQFIREWTSVGIETSVVSVVLIIDTFSILQGEGGRHCMFLGEQSLGSVNPYAQLLIVFLSISVNKY